MAALRTVISRYVVPGVPTPWALRMTTLHGGKQEGTELVVLDNGKLIIYVIPTRGLGILAVLREGVRFGWESPVPEVVNPRFIDLNARGGLGWLDGFNEWLCRCGMEWNGHPGKDTFTDATGSSTTLDLTLHGKVANLPTQELEILALRKPPYTITLRGVVSERMFHGPNLELATELSTEPGSSSFRLRDSVINRGGIDQEFQMLYHVNYGRPVLESGATFLAPAERITPFDDHAAKDIASYDQYDAPVAGAREQVYCIVPKVDEQGRTVAMIRNRMGDRAASIRFSAKELPFLTLWKNTSALADGYVTGIEPGTNFPHNRRIERKHGRVPVLAPGAAHTMNLEFGFHLGSQEVEAIAAEVNRIQGSTRPVLDDHPEEDTE
jgi:hypothetical protein